MAQLQLFFMYVRLEFRKKTHLVALYELRFFLATWGVIIFIQTVAEFITLEIGIAEAMLYAMYSFALIRLPYAFGVNEQEEHYEEEHHDWEAFDFIRGE